MSESTNKILKDIRDGSGGVLVIPMTYSEEYVVADDSYDCTVIIDATYDDIENAITDGKSIIFTMDYDDDDYAGVRNIIPTEVSAYHYHDDSPSEYEVSITMADLSRRGPFLIRGYAFVQNANQKLEAAFNIGGDK